MSILQLIKILLARWKTGLLVLIVVASAGLYWAWKQPALYTAIASLVVDSRGDPVMGMNALTTPGFLATQVEIIQSPRVGNRVIKNLKLQQNVGMREQYMRETKGEGTFDEWLTKLLQRAISVSPVKGSNIITVSFSGVERNFAALMANEFAKSYMETVLELKLDPAKRYSQFFDDRSKALRDNFEKAQSALSSYQREKGIVVSDERVDTETTKIADLSNQLTALQSAAIEAASRQAQAQKNADRTAEVMSSGIVIGLKSELNRLEIKLSELKTRLGDKHPQVVETETNIRDVNIKIAAETQRVTGAVVVAENVVKQREVEIRAALNAQKSKVIRMKDVRDELAVLQRDVDNAKLAYDGVRQRFNQTSMESESQLINVSVLSPAAVPSDSPDKSRINNAGKALAAALAAALMAAFFKEMLDRRVRVASDVFAAINAPVIGYMPGPDRKSIFGRKRLTLLQKRLLGHSPAPSARTS
jgi:polysaccharide biosynthesis transport protein